MAFGRLGAAGTGFGRLGSTGSGGGVAAAVGGGALLTGEANGFATDFTYATDASRVAVKTAGTVVSSGTSFFTSSGASSKWVYDINGTLVNIPAVTLPLDYDPVTHAAKGLLCEPAGTNLCLRSDDLTNASWVKTTMTTAKTATGPDGVANSATTVTASSANATALQTITSVSAARITSVFLKRRTGTGNVDLTQNNGSTWTTQTLTSSWARFSLPTVTSANPVVGIRLVTSGNAVDVALFQHELGDAVTSPIPTTTATVTRAANSYNVTAASIGYSATAGSWWVENYILSGNNDGRIIGTTGSASPLFYNGGAYELYEAPTLLYVLVPNTSGSVQKAASAYTAGSRGISANGLAAATDTGPTTLLLSAATLYFGSSGGASMHGYIRKAKYLPRRMTNAELATESAA